MSDPITDWLASQRELTERWLAAAAQVGSQAASSQVGSEGASAAQDPANFFWRTIAQGLSPQARELAQQLSRLGPGFLAGAGDAMFELFGASLPGSATESNRQPFARWLELAPLGYFREHHEHAQELARAVGDYQRIAAQMTAAIAKIHSEALELLAKKTETLAETGDTVSDSRRLYDLWIECGEQAFAQQARGDVFGLLQGEMVNAGMRVRAAQQTIAENFLKSLDLPTRAELNSVHKRLKDLRERIEQLEQAASSRDGHPETNRRDPS